MLETENILKYNPYVDIENNLENEVNKKIGKRKLRRVYRRSVILSIIYTIITGGIYWFFWQYEIAKETNKLTDSEDSVCPALVVFLTFITLGIFGVYWAYKIGKKQENFYKNHAKNKNLSVCYLVLSILNYLFPILNLICYALMQDNNNHILKICEKFNKNGVFVSDHNIFNRPYLSVILLFLIANEIPQIFILFFEKLFIGQPGNPSNLMVSSGDLIQDAIKTSAEQAIYADSLFVITHSILQIFLVIGVLWWFLMRFKHSNYKGVLCLKNLGRACLFALPGILFCLINVLGIDFNQLKFGIILLGFVPGFSEEITFRGMIIPNFMRIFNRSKGIWLSLIISSLLFGVIHISNVLVGADVGSTLLQVFYACGLGFLLASILIRTGNLWPCIIIHALIDALALMAPEALEQGAVQTQALTWSPELIPIIVISLFFIFYGIFICRPKKHEEICQLWAEKWGDAVLNA